MSIKLDTLKDWKPLTGSIGLRGEDRRRVKIYVNCEAVTPLWIAHDGDEPDFLTTVPYGLSTLEFWADGDVEIAPPADFKSIVKWQSTEDDEFTFDGDGETFATIHVPQPRNEALEYVQYQALLNQQRMEAAMREQMETHLAAMEAKYGGSNNGVHGSPSAEHPKSEGQQSGGNAAPVPSGQQGQQQPANVQPASPVAAGEGNNQPPASGGAK